MLLSLLSQNKRRIFVVLLSLFIIILFSIREYTNHNVVLNDEIIAQTITKVVHDHEYSSNYSSSHDRENEGDTLLSNSWYNVQYSKYSPVTVDWFLFSTFHTRITHTSYLYLKYNIIYLYMYVYICIH
jgi:hypothetical protein